MALMSWGIYVIILALIISIGVILNTIRDYFVSDFHNKRKKKTHIIIKFEEYRYSDMVSCFNSTT